MGMTIPAPEIRTVAISDLKPWGKNPRKSHAVNVLVESIGKFGYLVPIIIQKNTMRVLAGHGRLQAIVKSGATEVPVIVADLDDAAADQFTITDNKAASMSEWDFQSLADSLKAVDVDWGKLGWTKEELEPLLNAEWNPVGSEGRLDDFSRPKMGVPIQTTKEQRATVERAFVLARKEPGMADATEGALVAFVCQKFVEGR